jgi:ribosomal protein S4
MNKVAEKPIKVTEVMLAFGLCKCIGSARVAILEHRVYINARKVTHTDMILPRGLSTVTVKIPEFQKDKTILVYTKEAQVKYP